MKKREPKAKRTMFYHILLGVLGTILVLGSVLFLDAVLLSNGVLDITQSKETAIISCVLCVFLGTLIAVHGCGYKGLLVSLAVSMIFFVVLLVVGFYIAEKTQSQVSFLPVFLACLCPGILSGLIGKKTKKRRY